MTSCPRAPHLLSLLALLPLALPLAAQEKDAATRYHEAYVLEVIDGKIAEAAKAYLALEGENGSPDRIRRQAGFRFAVCTALLGRADEARARLAALAATDGLDPKLRAQVDEYRRALEGVAAGSALQARLDDLLFKLGRASSNAVNFTPNAYRDFQILGDKARPFLNRLLGHSDEIVRRHAFRVLLRMNEPGMMKHWKKAYYPQGNFDVRDYLQHNPSEIVVFEKFIRAGNPLARAVVKRIGGNRIGWSAAALRRIGITFPRTAAQAAMEQIGNQEIDALVDQWLRSGKAIAPNTALVYLERINLIKHNPANRRFLDKDRFPHVVAALASHGDGLRVYADAMPVRLVLAAFAARVKRDLATSKGQTPAQIMADSLSSRTLEPGPRDRFRDLLVGWIERSGGAHRVGASLRAAGAGDAVIRKLLAGPLRHQAEALADYVDFKNPEDIESLGMLLRHTGAGGRSLVYAFERATAGELARDVRVAIARHGPAWLAHDSSTQSLAFRIVKAAIGLSDEQIKACLLRCVAAAQESTPSHRQRVLGAWFAPRSAPRANEFQVAHVLPHRDLVLAQLRDSERTVLVELLVAQWQSNPLVQKRLPGVAKTILDNVEYLSSPARANSLAREPTIFPPADWYHRVRILVPLPNATLAAAAVSLKAHPGKARPKLVSAVLQGILVEKHVKSFSASNLQRHADLLRVLFRTGDAVTITRLASIATTSNVSAQAVREALTKLLAAKNSETFDLAAVGHLAMVAAEIEADSTLVPVAATLLHGKQAKHVKVGIRLARSLAKPELRGDLIALLDSPDANIRNAAKEALEAIAEWQRFREKVKNR